MTGLVKPTSAQTITCNRPGGCCTSQDACGGRCDPNLNDGCGYAGCRFWEKCVAGNCIDLTNGNPNVVPGPDACGDKGKNYLIPTVTPSVSSQSASAPVSVGSNNIASIISGSTGNACDYQGKSYEHGYCSPTSATGPYLFCDNGNWKTDNGSVCIRGKVVCIGNGAKKTNRDCCSQTVSNTGICVAPGTSATAGQLPKASNPTLSPNSVRTSPRPNPTTQSITQSTVQPTAPIPSIQTTTKSLIQIQVSNDNQFSPNDLSNRILTITDPTSIKTYSWYVAGNNDIYIKSIYQDGTYQISTIPATGNLQIKIPGSNSTLSINSLRLEKITINHNDVNLETLINEGQTITINSLENYQLPVNLQYNNGSVKTISYQLTMPAPPEGSTNPPSPTTAAPSTAPTPTEPVPALTVSDYGNRSTTIISTIVDNFYRQAIANRNRQAVEDAGYLSRIDPNLNQDRINFLILGIGGEGFLTDSIQILSYRVQTNTIALISLPRDLMAPEIIAKAKTQGYDYTNSRLNQALAMGSARYGYNDAEGLAFTKTVVEDATGIAVDYAAVINFNWVTGFINNTMGKIPIHLDAAIHDSSAHLDIAAGDHLIDGNTAIQLARSRYTTSDFARSSRQQLVIKGYLQAYKGYMTDTNHGLLDKVSMLFRTRSSIIEGQQKNQLITDFNLGDLVLNQLSSVPKLAILLNQSNIGEFPEIVNGVSVSNQDLAGVVNSGVESANIPNISLLKMKGKNPLTDSPTTYWDNLRTAVKYSLAP